MAAGGGSCEMVHSLRLHTQLLKRCKLTPELADVMLATKTKHGKDAWYDPKRQRRLMYSLQESRAHFLDAGSEWMTR